jgi:hypothetical protein
MVISWPDGLESLFSRPARTWRNANTLGRYRFRLAIPANWQSEFLQLLSMVVLTAWLIHTGSAESRDSTDRMEAKIDEIKRLVEWKKR